MRHSLATLAAVALVASFPTAPCLAQGTASEAEPGPRFMLAMLDSRKPPVRVNASAIPALQRRITLRLDGVDRSEALQAISRASGLPLVKANGIVPPGGNVRLKAEEITVAAALTEALFGTGVDLIVTPGGSAVLVRRVAERTQVGVIVGRVTAKQAGGPLAGATVEVQGTQLSVVSDADGRYRIASVPAGTHTVRARYIGYLPAATSVTVPDEQEVTADFALEKSAQKLDEVVTTGTLIPTEVRALPAPVTVITDSLITRQQPHTMAELFRQNVPGAVSWSPANEPYLTAYATRGATTLLAQTGQMKIFIDGLEVANGSAAPMDPASIERVEVIRGPEAAAVYGSDAIGGVVQIFTKRGQANGRPQLDLQLASGLVQTPYDGRESIVRQNYSGSVHGGSSDATYNAGGSYLRTGEYVVNDFSTTSSLDGYAGLRYSHGIITVDISGRTSIHKTPGLLNPDLARTGYAFVSRPFHQINDFRSQAVGARVGIAPTGWWQNTLTIGIDRFIIDARQTEQRLTSPDDTLLFVFNQNETKSSIGFVSAVQATVANGVSGSLTAGIDYYDDPTTTFFSFATTTIEGPILGVGTNPITASRDRIGNTGEFVQGQLGLYETAFLTLGLRIEQNTAFGDSIGTVAAPRVGLSLVRDVGGATAKLRGSWGRAIRAPDPQYKRAGGSTTSRNLANPTLAPERQQGWDAGVELMFGGRASLGITYFDQKASNLIAAVPLPSDSIFTQQYQNIGRVKNTGVEVEGSLSAGALEFRAQYGYARARIEELGDSYTGDLREGDQVLASPKHTAGASVTVIPREGTTASIGATYVGSWTNYSRTLQYSCFGGTGPCSPSNRDYIVEYPSFVKTNLTVTQQLHPMASAFLSIHNVANDQSYEIDDSNPVFGRISTLGLRLRL